MNEEYKCKDCKWLTGQKNIRGVECMNPKLQEKWNKAKTLWMGELRKDTARYKQRNAPACKKFEAKESKPMSRYIDADALIAKMPTVMDMQDTYLPIHFKEWLIDCAPSIDIVRCKECKSYDTEAYQNGYGYCSNHMSVLEDGDFCSRGEREGE